MKFFETFLESSPLSTVSKKTIKMIGHHSRLRDMMGQSYPSSNGFEHAFVNIFFSFRQIYLFIFLIKEDNINNIFV